MTKIHRKELRSFGLLVGGILSVIGFWPTLFGAGTRYWAVIPAGLLLCSALLIPHRLDYLYQLWMKLGHLLGWINTRIILCIVFYGMFVPMGFVMRLAGKDPMRRRLDEDAASYRVPCKPRPGSHMLRQF